MSHNNCYLHSVEVERFIIILLVRFDEKCNLMNLMMVILMIKHTYAINTQLHTARAHSIQNAQSAYLKYMELISDLDQFFDFVSFVRWARHWKMSNIEHCRIVCFMIR